MNRPPPPVIRSVGQRDLPPPPAPPTAPMNWKSVVRTVGEPALAGTIAFVATKLLAPNANFTVDLKLIQPSIAATVGGTVGGVSFLTEGIKNFLLPKVPALHSVGNLLKPGITGATATLATMALLPFQPEGMADYLKMFAIGAGSEAAGGLVYDRYVLPVLQEIN